MPKNRALHPDAQGLQGVSVSPGLLQRTPMFMVECRPNVGGRKLPVNVHIVIIDKFFKVTQDRLSFVDLYLSNPLEKR
jgi:hypothetical protein